MEGGEREKFNGQLVRAEMNNSVMQTLSIEKKKKQTDRSLASVSQYGVKTNVLLPPTLKK